MSSSVIDRQAVRAILLTPQHDVLLMRLHEPASEEYFWVTPGGGILPDESIEDALRRELDEELGLRSLHVGPVLCRRQHTFNWLGRRLCQREQLHLVLVDRFEPHMSDPTETLVLDRFHWWALDELAQTTESITPRALSQIIARYLADGPPPELPEIEVCID